MNKIDIKFRELKNNKKTAFIPYITAGDPDMTATRDILTALDGNGADIIEVGIPFSDPLADGPTIQRAIKRSLDAGAETRAVMKMLLSVKKKMRAPVVFMTYYNILLSYGLEKFVRDSVKSGVSGVIVPDLPLEESGELSSICRKMDFCLIMLTAPTTPKNRFKKIASFSRGFIYYVSLTGVTGARGDMPKGLIKKIKELKKLTNKPLCVGFGISSPESAKAVACVADGVIVGSALIKIIEKNIGSRKKMTGEISRFAGDIAKAVHGKA